MPDHIQIGDRKPWEQYAVPEAGQNTFPFHFPIFKDDDIEVYVDGGLQTAGYTVLGAGLSEGGAVVFDSAVANCVVTVRRRLTIERTSDFQESGEFRARVLNDELDYQVAAIQQVADDLTRTLRLAATDVDADLELPQQAARADRIFAWDAEGRPTVSTLAAADLNGFQTALAAVRVAAAGAQVAAAEAGVAEANAETAEAHAEAAATQAAVSASQAAATLASALWRDVVHLTSADSPYAIGAADNGKLLVGDTSGGGLVVELAPIAVLGEPFSVSVKWEAGPTPPVIHADGSDTIDGAATYTFTEAGAVMLIADTSASPDQWEGVEISARAPVTFGTLPVRARTGSRLALFNLTR